MDMLFSLMAVLLVALIPIISILCRHQVRMAALLRQNPNPHGLPVTSEVQELRDLVAQQAMAIDSLANSQRELSAELRSNRLSSGINSSN